MNILKSLTQYIYCLPYFELALFVAAASVICAAVNSFLYKYSWWRYILIAIGTAYTMLLLYITLFGRTEPIVNSISLVPFESYIGYLNGVQEMLGMGSLLWAECNDRAKSVYFQYRLCGG